jgi:hypothetical protein
MSGSSMLKLPEGHERHYVYPIKTVSDGSLYLCLVEIRMVCQEHGDFEFYRVFEAYSDTDLKWVNWNLQASGCDHEIVSWSYWHDAIANDLMHRIMDDDDTDYGYELIPAVSLSDAVPEAIDLDPKALRADLESTLDQILGRA